MIPSLIFPTGRSENLFHFLITQLCHKQEIYVFLVMFESSKMQTKLRPNEFERNENISFPIGTIFLVDKLYEVLNFCDIFSKHKTRGVDINNLLQALISYKLTDNFSIKRSHDWINRPEVLDEFSLPCFSERTLYRDLEILGSNEGVA